jgi:hypothetical protein
MSRNEIEMTGVCLNGETKITRDGMVKFSVTEKVGNETVLKKRTNRMGRMDYYMDGDLVFTPTQLLRQMQTAPMREKIHDAGRLRIEMTSRSFLVHVKLPIEMENVDLEDALDDEIDNAMEIIMKKKEEMECSIL